MITSRWLSAVLLFGLVCGVATAVAVALFAAALCGTIELLAP